MQTTIQYHEAINLADELTAKQIREQKEALEEFRTEYCDMFSIYDWMHYEEKTGKSIKWLKANAKYSEQDELTNHVYSFLGNELDVDDLAAMNF